MNIENPIDNTRFIDVVDKYNKLRLLYNILMNWVHSITYNDDSSNDNTHNMNGLCTHDEADIKRQIALSFKSHLANFVLSQQIKDKTYGMFYTDIASVINMNTNISHMNEQESLKLLSYFEEEMRTFIKSNYHILNSSLYVKHKDENSSEEFALKVNQVCNLLTNNLKLLNDFYNLFKSTNTDIKQKYLNVISTKFTEIQNVLECISNYIMNTLTSAEHSKALFTIKHNLLEEQKQLKLDIEVMKQQIKKYTDQGNEMTELLNEYKKLCNMIDCLK